VARAPRNWLSTFGLSGFIGKFNVVNSASDGNANWLTLQSVLLQTVWASRIQTAMWFYGSNGLQPSNNLNVNPNGGADDPRLIQMVVIP
jgi:NADH:ubiquinone oxidoreductase subunit 2 (subunit N)